MRATDDPRDLAAAVTPDWKPVTEGGGIGRPKRKPGKRGRSLRAVATSAEWKELRAEKADGQVCRVCAFGFGYVRRNIELHHLVSRARGGDDVADNLVPLCPTCHDLITRNAGAPLAILAEQLTDAEYSYCIEKVGEGAMERLFKVRYSRAIGSAATAGDSGRLS